MVILVLLWFVRSFYTRLLRSSPTEKDPESRLSEEADGNGLSSLIPEPTIPDLTGEIDDPPLGHAQANGGNADVYRCRWKQPDGNETMVAVKVPRRKGDLDVVERGSRREASIWARLRHVNILPFYGVMRIDNMAMALVSPWIEKGSITDQLQCGVRWSYSQCMNIMFQVANGLQYLHNNSIIHGDLNGNNILMNSDGKVLLFDFGLSYIRGEPEYMISPQLSGYTLPWSAPEIVNDRRRPTTYSDIYSFGSVTLEVLAGVPPFKNTHALTLTGLYLRGRYRPTRPKSRNLVTDEMWDFMMKCWEERPEDRPSAQLVHSYFVDRQYQTSS